MTDQTSTTQTLGTNPNSQPRQVFEKTRAYLKQTGGAGIDPELQTHYCPLPLSRKVVVDFRTWVFLTEARNEFIQQVEVFLKQLMYRANIEYLTYSPGLLMGVSRPFLKVPLKRAEAAIYFKAFGELLYVSLRVAYRPFISWLRVLGFGFICSLFPVMIYVTRAIEDGYGQNLYSPYIDLPEPLSSALWGVAVIPSLINMLIVGTVLSIFSFLLGRGFLGWLHARYDELYRDDITTVWNMSELAIVSVADALDLEQIPVGDEPGQGSFQRTQLPRRKTRF